MDRKTFEKLVNEIRSASLDTLVERNFGTNGYAKGDNVSAIHNFEEGGKFLRDGGTPAEAAWSYMVKHLIALRDRVNNNDFEDLEEIKERCSDIINYTCIIWCIANEKNEKQNSKIREELNRFEKLYGDRINNVDGVIV